MTQMVSSESHNLDIQRYDLSIGQRELWYIHSMDGAAQTAYNEHLVYSIRGFLSVNALKKALQTLIQKHDILRTSFRKDQEGNLFQALQSQVELDFTLYESSDEVEPGELINQVINQPFDLTQASLMRVALIKKNEQDYVLAIIVHHIITDGTSFAIFVQDLNTFYNQAMRGESIDSIPNKASYFDHVRLEQENFFSKTYLDQVDSVVEVLKGYSALNFLTTPIGHEKIDIFSGNRVYFSLDKTICDKMNAFAQSNRITVFHFIYAAYCIFLSQYARSRDILIGVPFANREHDLERQIMGYFINTMPVRIDLHEKESFLELVARVKAQLFSCLCKQQVAFEHVAPKLNLGRKALGQHPLIQTLFVWGNATQLKLRFEGVEAAFEHEYFSKTSKFDLSLFMLEESKEKVTAYFEYRNALFDQDMIEQIANGFTILLNNILENPEALTSSYSLLDECEMLRMKERFFTAKLDRIVTQSLPNLFAETALRYPKKIGLVFGKQRFDYETIEMRSNQWATYIRAQYQQHYGKQLSSDTLVALFVDRNEDMIFGMLGILKAGAAYVPVDPKYPQERINYIINHSQAALLLTHKEHDVLNLDFDANRIIYMDDEQIKQSPEFVNKPVDHRINPQNLAYVLYTSGSTGKPKGVGVSHENIICLFESLKKQFDLSSNDVWSLFHTFCFDISVWEIWGAFLFGGTLLVVPYETARDTKEFYQLIAQERVTVLTQTASAFQMFINEDMKAHQKLEHLRYVSFVGESLKVSILRPWVEKYGAYQPRLANMYGITETTVYTNNKFVTQEDIDKGRDNIGWPLEEFSMCIMDDNLQWCPVGIVGEICIGGRGLSRGYLYRDDLTQEKFIQDPYASFLGLPENTRLYKTGDLGRWMEDGSIEYLGRKDFQIKLRGFRIELGEVEAALGSYPGVSHTVVLLKGEGETAYLSAYYTLKVGTQVEMENLREHLKSFLPEYMVPSMFTELPSFPMTVNGKIDRKILQALEDKIVYKKMAIPLNTKLEMDIAAIWADIFKMNVSELDASVNFFELGGNSLLVVKMLTLVNNHLNKEISLSQFIANPTIATLAAQFNTDTPKQQFEEFIKRLKQDIVLDAEIQPLSIKNPNLLNPEAILLTGVTGFLGAHMLSELLEKTSASIYCLVRASSLDEAWTLIVGKLTKYNLSVSQHFPRIIPVLGDLSALQLGLSECDLTRITQQVDAIFHVGAWVHHVFDYNTLYKTNVQSVKEVIKIATQNKNKAIHFVSTLATCFISPIERLAELDPACSEAYLNLNGYLTTKWVAEHLLRTASLRGIEAHVYRPGNVVAGTHGVYEAATNHTLLRLKGMLQLEKGYISPHETVEMMPVDLLAAALIDIAQNPELFAYNMNNSETVSWLEYLQMAQSRGYRFNFLDNEEEWHSVIANLDEDNALYKLSHLYKIRSTENQAETVMQEIMPNHNIVTPAYHDMVEQQLSALIESGFLDKPM